MGIEYKIIKDYGTIADHNGVQLKLRLISWNGNPERLDLRAWRNDYAMGGITMSKDELKKLGSFINELGLTHKTEIVEICSVDKTTEVPKQIEEKVEEKTEVKVEKKDNVIQLPLPKPDLEEKLVTEGNATYADCVAKIGREKTIYVDNDSQYVLNGILELCVVDADFRNNVMREDKDFAGALNYMAEMCKQGYGYKSDKYGFMDRDMGLGFTIDYFNLKPEEKKPEPTTTVKVEPKKRGRKKKGA